MPKTRLTFEIEVDADYSGTGTGAMGKMITSAYASIVARLSGHDGLTSKNVKRITLIKQGVNEGRMDLL